MNLYEQESDKQAVSLILNWFRQLAEHGKVSSEDYAELDHVYRTSEEVRTMLAATLERERKNIYQQGRTEGRAEGEEVGLVKGQRQTLLQLLQFRFQLSEEEQTKLTQQLGKINEGQTLTALTNDSLQAASLAEFQTHLIKYLPPDGGS